MARKSKKENASIPHESESQVSTLEAPAPEASQAAPDEPKAPEAKPADAAPVVALNGKGGRKASDRPIRRQNAPDLAPKANVEPKAPEAPAPAEADGPKRGRGRPRKDGLPTGTEVVKAATTRRTLTTYEAERLNSIEVEVEEKFSMFLRVGSLLLEVSEKRLYEQDYDSFSDYMRRRWDMTGRNGWYQVGAAGAIRSLEDQGVTHLPTTVTVARELAKVDGDLDRVKAWEAANELARAEGIEEPERRHVAKAVAQVKKKEAPVPSNPGEPDTVQAARANGAIPSGVTVDITPADHETEEPNEDKVDINERDEVWLARFPLNGILKDQPLRKFQAEALAYRWASGPRQTFIKSVMRPIVKEAIAAQGTSFLGPYLHRLRWGLSGPDPSKWVWCESCSGSGQVPTIGNCNDCHSSGYRV